MILGLACFLVFLRGSLATSLSPECQNVVLNYLYLMPTAAVRYCTTRPSFTGAATVYWLLDSCSSWADQNSTCGVEPGGALASLPAIQDKFYATQFISPYITGSVPSAFLRLESPVGGSKSCYGPGSFFLWVGLRRASAETQTWSWVEPGVETGTAPFWNTAIASVAGSNVLSTSGNCALMGWSEHGGKQEGWIQTDCMAKAPALCMKTLG